MDDPSLRRALNLAEEQRSLGFGGKTIMPGAALLEIRLEGCTDPLKARIAVAGNWDVNCRVNSSMVPACDIAHGRIQTCRRAPKSINEKIEGRTVSVRKNSRPRWTMALCHLVTIAPDGRQRPSTGKSKKLQSHSIKS